MRQGPEMLAAIFLEAGRCGDGRSERHAGVFAARRGCHSDANEEAARGVVSARRGRRLEYRRAFWRVELLPYASYHCDSTAQAWRHGCGDRPSRIFRLASKPPATPAALPQ